MSVVAQQAAEFRRFAGYRDNRFPMGTWHCRALGVGDASGGTITIDCILALSTQRALNSTIFSLEQHDLSRSDGNAGNYRLFSSNASGPSNAALIIDRVGLMIGVGSVARSALDLKDSGWLPLFIGSQRFQGITFRISIGMPNADGISFIATFQGYYWSARSVLADGGPQRPPTGLYRA